MNQKRLAEDVIHHLLMQTSESTFPRGTWGLIDKDLDRFSQRQLVMDYSQMADGVPESIPTP